MRLAADGELLEPSRGRDATAPGLLICSVPWEPMFLEVKGETYIPISSSGTGNLAGNNHLKFLHFTRNVIDSLPHNLSSRVKPYITVGPGPGPDLGLFLAPSGCGVMHTLPPCRAEVQTRLLAGVWLVCPLNRARSGPGSGG